MFRGSRVVRFRSRRTTRTRDLPKIRPCHPRTIAQLSISFLDDAVDALLGRQKGQSGVSAANAARLRTAAKVARDFVTSASTAQRSYEPFLAGTRQIVAGTCVGLGRPSLGLISIPFDLVIVDEAARCTASELSGRWIILVGDQAQLEPLHKPEMVQQVANRVGFPKGDIIRCDFDRLFAKPYGTAAGRKLKTQYRMLPPSGRIVSDTFYPEIDLEHGREIPEIDPKALPDELSAPLSGLRRTA
jgi:AAA domain-containing protein